MFRIFTVIAIVLLTISVPVSAEAAFYEIAAKLVAHEGGAETTVVVDGKGVLPLDTLSHGFESLVIHLKKDAASAAQIEDLRNLVVVIQVGDTKRVVSVNDLEPGQKRELLKLDDLRTRDGIANVRIEVQSKFSTQYLCEVERDHIRKGAKPLGKKDRLAGWLALETKKPVDPKKGGKPAIDLDAASLDALALYKLLADQGNVDGDDLVYSFCFGAFKKIDWEAVKEDTGKSKQAHADRTAQKVLARLREQLPGVAVQYDRPEGSSYPKNMYMSDTHVLSFSGHLAGQLAVFELAAEKTTLLTRMVDQDSKIVVRPRRGFCEQVGSCNKIVKDGSIFATIDGKDDEGNDLRARVELDPEGDFWTLKAELSKFLLQRVTLTIHYKLGAETFPIERRDFTVENLGFITTFPVVTEIASLAGNWNEKDLEAKSTIPISWAYNFNGDDGRLAAVTFPFMVGFNPRSAPRLADVVKFFPHISLLAPLTAESETGARDGDTDDEGTAQMLLGAGIAFVNAFTIGYGASVTSDKPANFLMLGVSAPDLVKLFEASE